jgi:CTP synthase (UTP-ammonia lyase)
MTTKIAILGDFNPAYPTHHALNDNIRLLLKNIDVDLQFDWVGTDVFNSARDFKRHYQGLWIAPGSPYQNTQNVLDSIRFARERQVPTFGNCGGFQHMILEFAQNVCGIQTAAHEETDPQALDLVISRLPCSLVEQSETISIIDSASRLFQIIGKSTFTGRYFCNFGLNPMYLNTLQKHGLSFSAISPDMQVRAIELKTHPFYLGTLFQPALTPERDRANPIITAFVMQCVQN